MSEAVRHHLEKIVFQFRPGERDRAGGGIERVFGSRENIPVIDEGVFGSSYPEIVVAYRARPFVANENDFLDRASDGPSYSHNKNHS